MCNQLRRITAKQTLQLQLQIKEKVHKKKRKIKITPTDQRDGALLQVK